MSSGFRVTQRTITTTMMTGLQANMSRMEQLQEQLSSGRQINRPSDSPVKTVEAMQFRSGLRLAEQYVRNADDGLALLDVTDKALSSAVDITRRAQELTLQGRNASSGAQAREAIAAEIDGLRASLLGVANSRYLDRPVFGGNADTALAYAVGSSAQGGGEYQGDGGTVLRTVAGGTQVEVNVTGPQAFGGTAGEPKIFDVLAGISAALRNQPATGGVTDLGDGLTKLGQALERVVATAGKVGARVNRVETMRTQAQDQLDTLTTSLSEVENIDLPKTIVELQMQETAYKAALGATARVVQPSLLDFLR